LKIHARRAEYSLTESAPSPVQAEPTRVELACRKDEGIFILRHGFSDAKKIPFDELMCAANAFGYGLGDVLLGWSV
jgi:hypothetical protein